MSENHKLFVFALDSLATMKIDSVQELICQKIK